MIKRIFILWFQGIENAPYVVKKCVESWKYYNPNWDVRILHENNLHKYINIQRIKCKKISLSDLSEIIKVMVLHKYGGLWCDANLLCNKSLDEWLYDYVHDDFFALRRSIGNNRTLCSSFLYARKDSYILEKMYKKILLNGDVNYYLNKKFSIKDVFINLYNIDRTLRTLWENVPHYYETNISNKNSYSPMYKLDYKMDEPTLCSNNMKYFLYKTTVSDKNISITKNPVYNYVILKTSTKKWNAIYF